MLHRTIYNNTLCQMCKNEGNFSIKCRADLHFARADQTEEEKPLMFVA